MIRQPTCRLLTGALLLAPALARPAAAQPAGGRNPAPGDSLAGLKRGYSWRRPVPRALLRPLSPDRPDITESAYSVDAGHFQLETDLVRLGQSRFGAENQSQELALNHANVKIGLSRRADLQS